MADFLNSYYKAGKKPRPDCKGQDNFSLGQVKNASLGSGGQVKLISVILISKHNNRGEQNNGLKARINLK